MFVAVTKGYLNTVGTLFTTATYTSPLDTFTKVTVGVTCDHYSPDVSRTKGAYHWSGLWLQLVLHYH